MYHSDPIYPIYTPVRQSRMWPWVLLSLLVVVGLWAYFEPIPELSTPEKPVYQAP